MPQTPLRRCGQHLYVTVSAFISIIIRDLYGSKNNAGEPAEFGCRSAAERSKFGYRTPLPLVFKVLV
jgi:hypothetical protein